MILFLFLFYWGLTNRIPFPFQINEDVFSEPENGSDTDDYDVDHEPHQVNWRENIVKPSDPPPPPFIENKDTMVDVWECIEPNPTEELDRLQIPLLLLRQSNHCFGTFLDLREHHSHALLGTFWCRASFKYSDFEDFVRLYGSKLKYRSFLVAGFK